MPVASFSDLCVPKTPSRLVERRLGQVGAMIDPAEPNSARSSSSTTTFDCANPIVLADQPSRHSGALHPIGALNEAPHPIPPQIAWESYPENHFQQRVFTQPGQKLPLRERPVLAQSGRSYANSIP
jgi:hypothetical protein